VSRRKKQNPYIEALGVLAIVVVGLSLWYGVNLAIAAIYSGDNPPGDCVDVTCPEPSPTGNQ
jgi:hypothetical protein